MDTRTHFKFRHSRLFKAIAIALIVALLWNEASFAAEEICTCLSAPVDPQETQRQFPFVGIPYTIGYGYVHGYNKETIINLVRQAFQDSQETLDEYGLDSLDWTEEGDLVIESNNLIFTKDPKRVTEVSRNKLEYKIRDRNGSNARTETIWYGEPEKSEADMFADASLMPEKRLEVLLENEPSIVTDTFYRYITAPLRLIVKDTVVLGYMPRETLIGLIRVINERRRRTGQKIFFFRADEDSDINQGLDNLPPATPAMKPPISVPSGQLLTDVKRQEYLEYYGVWAEYYKMLLAWGIKDDEYLNLSDDSVAFMAIRAYSYDNCRSFFDALRIITVENILSTKAESPDEPILTPVHDMDLVKYFSESDDGSAGAEISKLLANGTEYFETHQDLRENLANACAYFTAAHIEPGLAPESFIEAYENDLFNEREKGLELAKSISDKNGTIADLGAGIMSLYTIAGLENPPRMLCVDNNGFVVALINKFAELTAKGDKIRAINADITELPSEDVIPADSVDHAQVNYTLHHVKNLDGFIAFLKHILKDMGTFGIVDQSGGHEKNAVYRHPRDLFEKLIASRLFATWQDVTGDPLDEIMATGALYENDFLPAPVAKVYRMAGEKAPPTGGGPTLYSLPGPVILALGKILRAGIGFLTHRIKPANVEVNIPETKEDDSNSTLELREMAWKRLETLNDPPLFRRFVNTILRRDYLKDLAYKFAYDIIAHPDCELLIMAIKNEPEKIRSGNNGPSKRYEIYETFLDLAAAEINSYAGRYEFIKSTAQYAALARLSMSIPAGQLPITKTFETQQAFLGAVWQTVGDESIAIGDGVFGPSQNLSGAAHDRYMAWLERKGGDAMAKLYGDISERAVDAGGAAPSVAQQRAFIGRAGQILRFEKRYASFIAKLPQEVFDSVRAMPRHMQQDAFEALFTASGDSLQKAKKIYEDRLKALEKELTELHAAYEIKRMEEPRGTEWLIGEESHARENLEARIKSLKIIIAEIDKKINKPKGRPGAPSRRSFLSLGRMRNINLYSFPGPLLIPISALIGAVCGFIAHRIAVAKAERTKETALSRKAEKEADERLNMTRRKFFKYTGLPASIGAALGVFGHIAGRLMLDEAPANPQNVISALDSISQNAVADSTIRNATAAETVKIKGTLNDLLKRNNDLSQEIDRLIIPDMFKISPSDLKTGVADLKEIINSSQIFVLPKISRMNAIGIFNDRVLRDNIHIGVHAALLEQDTLPQAIKLIALHEAIHLTKKQAAMADRAIELTNELADRIKKSYLINGANPALNPHEIVAMRLWDNKAFEDPAVRGLVREIIRLEWLQEAEACFLECAAWDSIAEQKKLSLINYVEDILKPYAQRMGISFQDLSDALRRRKVQEESVEMLILDTVFVNLWDKAKYYKRGEATDDFLIMVLRSLTSQGLTMSTEHLLRGLASAEFDPNFESGGFAKLRNNKAYEKRFTRWCLDSILGSDKNNERVNEKEAGMIPALGWLLEKAGISLTWQALVEQALFWGINVWLAAYIGSFWASVITWGAFMALHFVRTKNMPNAPPVKGIFKIAALNFIAFNAVHVSPTLALAGFFGVSVYHGDKNIEYLGIKQGRDLIARLNYASAVIVGLFIAAPAFAAFAAPVALGASVANIVIGAFLIILTIYAFKPIFKNALKKIYLKIRLKIYSWGLKKLEPAKDVRGNELIYSAHIGMVRILCDLDRYEEALPHLIRAAACGLNFNYTHDIIAMVADVVASEKEEQGKQDEALAFFITAKNAAETELEMARAMASRESTDSLTDFIGVMEQNIQRVTEQKAIKPGITRRGFIGIAAVGAAAELVSCKGGEGKEKPGPVTTYKTKDDMLADMGKKTAAFNEFCGFYYSDEEGVWRLWTFKAGERSAVPPPTGNVNGTWHSHPEESDILAAAPSASDLVAAYKDSESAVVLRHGEISILRKNLNPENKVFAEILRDSEGKIEGLLQSKGMVKKDILGRNNQTFYNLRQKMLAHVIQKFIIEKLPRDMSIFDLGGDIQHSYHINSWQTVAEILGFDIEDLCFSYSGTSYTVTREKSGSASSEKYDTDSPVRKLLEQREGVAEEYRDTINALLEEWFDTYLPYSAAAVTSAVVAAGAAENKAETCFGLPVEETLKRPLSSVVRPLVSERLERNGADFRLCPDKFNKIKPKGLILFADGIMKDFGFVDLQETLREGFFSENKVFEGGIITLYGSRDNCAILEKLIRGSCGDKVSLLTIERMSGNLRETEEIQYVARLARELCRESTDTEHEFIGLIKSGTRHIALFPGISEKIDMPIIVLSNHLGIYSFREALSMAFHLKYNCEKAKWIYYLSPVEKVSQEVFERLRRKALAEAHIATQA